MKLELTQLLLELKPIEVRIDAIALRIDTIAISVDWIPAHVLNNGNLCHTVSNMAYWPRGENQGSPQCL